MLFEARVCKYVQDRQKTIHNPSITIDILLNFSPYERKLFFNSAYYFEQKTILAEAASSVMDKQDRFYEDICRELIQHAEHTALFTQFTSPFPLMSEYHKRKRHYQTRAIVINGQTYGQLQLELQDFRISPRRNQELTSLLLVHGNKTKDLLPKGIHIYKGMNKRQADVPKRLIDIISADSFLELAVLEHEKHHFGVSVNKELEIQARNKIAYKRIPRVEVSPDDYLYGDGIYEMKRRDMELNFPYVGDPLTIEEVVAYVGSESHPWEQALLAIKENYKFLGIDDVGLWEETCEFAASALASYVHPVYQYFDAFSS